MKFYLLSTLIEQFKYEAKEFFYLDDIRLECSYGEYEKELDKSLSVEKSGLRNNDVIVISYN